jgi:phospho-N-acetylmuramoyl-pentapeptide-transferase
MDYPMTKIFVALLASAVATGLLAVPFINLLYRLKFQRQREIPDTVDGPVMLFDQMHAKKAGTPAAGGLLVLGVTVTLGVIMYQFTSFKANWTIGILALTYLLFGALGFYDDLRKFLEAPASGAWGIRAHTKLIVQLLFGLLVGYLLYRYMGLHEVVFPFKMTLDLGGWYVVFAALVIATMSNAFNITDGLDGLAAGLLVIALAAFWYLAVLFSTADVVLFIALLIGSLLAFLYFNIYPARVFMGDTGALALGAALAVIALMSRSSFALPFIGGVFMIELASSAIQMLSKATRGGRKVFLVAPLHHHFEARGWNETKVTMRFWLAGALFAFIGICVALL